MIHKPPEIGCKILNVFLYFFCERGLFYYFSKDTPTLNMLKPLPSALAETYFDPEDRGGFFSPFYNYAYNKSCN